MYDSIPVVCLEDVQPLSERARKRYLSRLTASFTSSSSSSFQLAVFRSLLFTSAEEEVQKSMVNNFRVQQPLCGRTVRSSFTPFLQEAPPSADNKH